MKKSAENLYIRFDYLHHVIFKNIRNLNGDFYFTFFNLWYQKIKAA